MRSICFFASYFTSTELPYYVKVYLQELKKQYKEVIFLSSKKQLLPTDLEFLKQQEIAFFLEENEGFDFGLWYKALQKKEVSGYERLVLVNDSCILFKSLDKFTQWAKEDGADVQGMSESSAISWHLQSYFLVINKRAIPHVLEYFKKQGILQKISDVIKIYEVGLSTYFVSRGLKLSAYIDNQGYQGEYSPYYYCIKHHILSGIPLIKKKIIHSSYRKDELFTLARMNFNVSARYYVDLIKKTNPDLIIDLDKVLDGRGEGMNIVDRSRYEITRKLIGLFRIFRKSKTQQH